MKRYQYTETSFSNLLRRFVSQARLIHRTSNFLGLLGTVSNILPIHETKTSLIASKILSVMYNQHTRLGFLVYSQGCPQYGLTNTWNQDFSDSLWHLLNEALQLLDVLPHLIGCLVMTPYRTADEHGMKVLLPSSQRSLGLDNLIACRLQRSDQHKEGLQHATGNV